MQTMQPAFSDLATLQALEERSATTFSPAAMAFYLRRSNPVNARCFAEAMHDDVAWASESWGQYWADVMRLV